MHLLLSRLGSPSRAAHPLARPGCQHFKKSPCRESESCSVTASPCSAWGRGRSISSSSACPSSSCSSTAGSGTSDTLPPPLSSPKKGWESYFKQPQWCDPQFTMWPTDLLAHPALAARAGSSSGAGRVVEPSQ